MPTPRLAPTLLFLLATPLAWTQNTTGAIVGAVRDPSDALVGDVKVTARNQATGFARTTETNAEGLYRFPLLPAGSYTIRVEKDGFKEIGRAHV